MTERMDGQASLFDQDTWYGKTYREHSAPTKDATLQQSLKKRSASQSRKPPIFQCLKKDGRPTADTAAWMDDGAWLGECWTRNGGECPNAAVGSRLSQILEAHPHTKYYLTAKACMGILRRAERRGKDLPEKLKAALRAQSGLGGGCDGGGKGALVQTEKSGTLGTGNDQTVFCLQGNGIDRADTAGCNGKGWREDVSYTLNTIDRPAVCAGFKLGNSEQARSIGFQEEQSPTLNAERGGNKPAVVYSFDSLASNSMRSPNPKSGCREVDTARTLDTTSPDPSKNQGGIAILDMSHDVSGTLRAQEYGHQPAVMAFDTTQITSKQNGSIPDFGKPCHTLNANVHVPCAVLDMSHACDVIRDCREVAPSLQARMGTGDNQIPLTYQMQGFGDYREGGVASSCKQRDFKDGTDLVCAVDCRNFREGGEVNGTLQAKESGGQSLNLNNTVRQNRVVRRLTPMECERLQGFPDHWTDIGAWTDENGKLHRESSDSARYKALGNSIALPPWKWVLKRICAQYERDATLGSLFDGIGGFPLLWTQLNGWGSVKWASEIEPFCIAVTKRHFGDAETGEAGDLWKHLMGGSDE